MPRPIVSIRAPRRLQPRLIISLWSPVSSARGLPPTSVPAWLSLSLFMKAPLSACVAVTICSSQQSPLLLFERNRAHPTAARPDPTPAPSDMPTSPPPPPPRLTTPLPFLPLLPFLPSPLVLSAWPFVVFNIVAHHLSRTLRLAWRSGRCSRVRHYLHYRSLAPAAPNPAHPAPRTRAHGVGGQLRSRAGLQPAR